MTLKLGAYTAYLHDRPLAAALDVRYGFCCAAWPQDPAWRFVAVGVGHDVPPATPASTAWLSPPPTPAPLPRRCDLAPVGQVPDWYEKPNHARRRPT